MRFRLCRTLRLLSPFLLLTGCTQDRPTPAAHATAASTGFAQHPAGLFALAYAAPAEETLIADAQARLRAAPGDAAAAARLVQAFLVRRRETGDDRYLAYARDAHTLSRANDPNHAAVLHNEVLFLHDAHRFNEALSMTQQFAAQAPGSSLPWLLKGDAELELGRYEEALNSFQRAIDKRPDLRSYARGAHMRWLENDVEGALDLMRLALDSASPGDLEATAFCWVELGTMQLHQGMYALSLQSADRALRVLPGYLPAVQLQGEAHLSRGELTRAIPALSRVAELRPTARAHLRLSEALSLAGQDQAALAERQAGEQHAQHEPVEVSLYYSRHNLKPAQALALATKAVALRPQLAAYQALAAAQLRNGQLEQAAEAIETALRLNTPLVGLHLVRGLIQARRGQHDAAELSLRAAQSLNAGAYPGLLQELRDALRQPERGLNRKG